MWIHTGAEVYASPLERNKEFPVLTQVVRNVLADMQQLVTLLLAVLIGTLSIIHTVFHIFRHSLDFFLQSLYFGVI